MGLIATIKAILDTRSDASLGVFVRLDPPGPADLAQIDIDAAIDMVVAGASDWQIKKTISDDSGTSITKDQVKTFRSLVEDEQRERDAVLNPPPEGEELP